MNNLLDIEPISIHGGLDNWFDVDLNEAIQVIFSDRNNSDNLEDEAPTDSSSAFSLSDEPRRLFTGDEESSRLILKEDKPSQLMARKRTIDHGYNPVHSLSKCSQDEQPHAREAANLEPVPYNFEEYQHFQATKKRRVVSCNETSDCNFEEYQKMPFQGLFTESNYRLYDEAVQKLDKPMQRHQFSMPSPNQPNAQQPYQPSDLSMAAQNQLKRVSVQPISPIPHQSFGPSSSDARLQQSRAQLIAYTDQLLRQFRSRNQLLPALYY